jgi:general secretion pathway protein G
MAFLIGAGKRGFTLIELLVVLAILALLLTIATPRYFSNIEQSKLTVLRKNLHVTRTTIDDFYGDNGRYPRSLEELVERGYMRTVPLDPITDSTATWILIAPEKGSGIFNLHSGAPGLTREGLAYKQF